MLKVAGGLGGDKEIWIPAILSTEEGANLHRVDYCVLSPLAPTNISAPNALRVLIHSHPCTTIDHGCYGSLTHKLLNMGFLKSYQYI